ncbi:IclR family transcriptional regulator [Cryobacterium adonitolivorans]|uniref:Glycerol operon regulatory protein n=2 Tax=Cryobacterium adonitolivorans TaxID=1259189 RepID=A0A4R8W5R1_9MICO|nr:IclR family transcriptional regulator [Cryobacterium adonitolivorans]
MSEFSPVKSADRTLEVLEHLAAKGSSSLVEMSRTLDIPKSSLHSILRTLEHRGWAESDPTRSTYQLGINALLIGASYVDQDLIVTRTSESLDSLAAATGETIHLGRLEGTDVVYLAKRESRHPLRMFSAIGRRLPAHATGLGKALLAELDDERVLARLVDPLPAITERTITTKAELVARLATVRASGYAIDDEEACIGMRCFAVSLPFANPPKDAISCSVPFARLDEDREREIISLLLETKVQLARQFSGRRF